jgi:hypothetical protein
MPIFKSSEEVYATIGELMDRAKSDPQVAPRIAKSGVVIQFRYTNPDAVTTINAKTKPTQPGALLDVYQGESPMKPDIVMTMSADMANNFWNKKVNLVAALAKGEIKLQGPQMKVLALLPAIEPLYDKYRALVKEKGMEHLIVK